MTTMFDSVNITHIPKTAQYVAGYVNGNWPTFNSLVKEFPTAVCVSIDVNGSAIADVLDVEVGDATPEQSVAWVVKMRKLGRPGIVYCSRSLMPAVQHYFIAANVAQPYFWIADWTNEAHLVAGSVATQWADGSVKYPGYARWCDTTLLSAAFPVTKTNKDTK